MTWALCFGWVNTYGRAVNFDPNQRPAHIKTLCFHSFEAALHFHFNNSRGTWWEILTPDDQVALSSRAGFNHDAVPSPSLCARQILHTRYADLFPESVEELLIGRDRRSHDDGVTWESVLLGEKEEVRKPILPSLPKPNSVEILTVSSAAGPGWITLTHAAGSLTVKVSSLELQKSRTGYSLWVLNTSRRIYTRDVGEGAVILLQSFGVPVADEKEKLPKGFVKAWKPTLFKVQQSDGKEPLEVKGQTRGLLGIDKRRVELSRTWRDYQGEEKIYTYTETLYHLTHLPTGLLIARWKHKNVAEEFADLLRSEMPYLTDTGIEVTPEIGKRVREILDRFSA